MSVGVPEYLEDWPFEYRLPEDRLLEDRLLEEKPLEDLPPELEPPIEQLGAEEVMLPESCEQVIGYGTDQRHSKP